MPMTREHTAGAYAAMTTTNGRGLSTSWKTLSGSPPIWLPYNLLPPRQPQPERCMVTTSREPVRRNFRPARRERQTSLRRCRIRRHQLVVESGVVCPLYTPQRVRDFFDAVDMPALGYNMDPVNLVGSLDIAYDTTSLINECIDLMSPEIVGCDAKDFTIIDALLPHFEEEVIGAPNAMLDKRDPAYTTARSCTRHRGHRRTLSRREDSSSCRGHPQSRENRRRDLGLNCSRLESLIVS